MNWIKPFISVSLLLAIFIVSVFVYRSFLIPTSFWELRLSGVGTNSSCRVVDLNGDGTLDIVVGGGGKEYEKSEFGVIAVDGDNGTLLWNVPCRNQIVGSAIFLDITGDEIPDVFIGGRSAQLFAINGRNGAVLWEYLPDSDTLDMVNDTTLLNFFNPQLIPDQDGDAVDDLLVSFGGYVKALPHEHNRPVGSLMIISTKTGKVLAKANMPDKKETYMSPVVNDFKNDGEVWVIYGTGGETITGNLYAARIADIMKEDLAGSIRLAEGNGKGFISPPTLVDITNDGVLDIVANSFNGRMMAFDGMDFRKIWETRIGDQLETYSCIAPFHANDDGIIDFFSNYGVGEWPYSSKAIQVVVDGSSGNIMMRDSLGIFQYASPVAFDFTKDGKEDIMFVINNCIKHVMDTVADGGVLKRYTNRLLVFDVYNGKVFDFLDEVNGTNFGSTPLIVDLDGNGLLDIVTCRMTDQFDFFAYKDLVITRTETRIRAREIRWGAYQGSAHDGRLHF